MQKVLIVDPSISGISGDMFLGALIGLGLKPQRIEEIATHIEKTTPWVKRVEVSVKTVKKGEFKAWLVEPRIDEDKRCRKGLELLNTVNVVAKALGLDDKAYAIAVDTVRLLIDAEAEVHGDSVEDVSLCEISSADTVLDIVGVAFALQELDLLSSRVYGLPIAIGGGTINFSHGVISTPSPIVLEIAKKKNLILFGGVVEEEVATPTGVAIYATIVQDIVKFYPMVRVLGVGYGAGSRDFPYVPNVLRLVLGEAVKDYAQDNVVVLETDIDDVSGEILGYVMEKIMSTGALDVSCIPRIGKKGRPSVTLRVLTKPEDQDKLVDIIFSETGTLGVRVLGISRYIVPTREFIEVPVEIDGKRYSVRVKVGRSLSGEVVAMKPEYEDIKRIALETGTPLRTVVDIVMRQLRK